MTEPSGYINPWTDERTELLKKLWADGYSAGAIAMQLNDEFSRNAILGKIHRLGLSRPIEKKPLMRKAREQSWPRNKIKALARERKMREWEIAAWQATELPPEQADNPVTINDLEPQHCRWPCSGVGRDMIFCGGEAIKDHSYCGRHCRIAYTAPDKRMSRAEFQARGRELARNYKARSAA